MEHINPALQIDTSFSSLGRRLWCKEWGQGYLCSPPWVSLVRGVKRGFLVIRAATYWGMPGHPPVPDPLIIHRLHLLTSLAVGAAEQVQVILRHGGLHTTSPPCLATEGTNKSRMNRKLLGWPQRGHKRGPSILFLGIPFSCVAGSPVCSRERVSSIISFCFSITDPLRLSQGHWEGSWVSGKSLPTASWLILRGRKRV